MSRPVWINDKLYVVDVADTVATRQRGLQGRTALDVDAMLFKYDAPTYKAFWMKDVLIPLTICFFGENGYYLGSKDMTPGSLDPVLPPGPFTYALEFPQGTGPILSRGDKLHLLTPW